LNDLVFRERDSVTRFHLILRSLYDLNIRPIHIYTCIYIYKYIYIYMYVFGFESTTGRDAFSFVFESRYTASTPSKTGTHTGGVQ